jgi:signal transduction histidine kinase
MFFSKRKRNRQQEPDTNNTQNNTTLPDNPDISDSQLVNKEDIVWVQRMVSHNVRMPMSIIRGYGDLLKGGLLDKKEQQEAIKNICDNIMYLDQVINIIFEYDKPDEISLTKVDVAQVLKRVTGYVKDMAVKNKITINLKLKKDQLYVKADVMSVMRMIYQLLENAFKYLDEGGIIDISAYEADDHVLVVYKDNGYGMSENELSKVTQRGFRGNNTSGKSGSGFGIS